jgi:hypothetical protein
MKTETINAQTEADWYTRATTALEQGRPLRLTGLTIELLEEFLQCAKARNIAKPLPKGHATPLMFSLEMAPAGLRE